MKSLLLVLVLAAAAGALVYRFVLLTPEARLCARFADLCGEQAAASCESDFGKLRKAVGPEAVERGADCMADSETCIEATACMATGLLDETVEQIGKGIQRSLGQE